MMNVYNEKRLLLITRIIKGKNHIFDKVYAQYIAFQNIGLKVDLIYIDEKFNIILNNAEIGSVFSRIGIHLLFFLKIKRIINTAKYDFIYIRNPFLLNQISYYRFLKIAKKNNVELILEIPTYPYEKEIKGFFSKILLLLEKIFQSKLKNHISLILYSGNSFNNIYGIKCIQLLNIANPNLIPLSKVKSFPNKLKLIGVSSCHDYNGFDRVIEGLHHYKHSDVMVEFHIIGNGPEFNRYLNLVNNYHLNDKVILHGKVYGDNLNILFNEMDIGVSCLGMHRIGLVSGSPLKSAEYALRGIPFLLAYNDPFFSDQSFCLSIPPNETPVEINDIIHWFSTNEFKHQDIRELTMKNVSWEQQFNSIITSLIKLN